MWNGLAAAKMSSVSPRRTYPWRWLVRSLLHEGTLPAWNPYVFTGNPLLDPQTGLFSPFNLPLWILPLLYALGVAAALKLLARPSARTCSRASCGSASCPACWRGSRSRSRR